MGLLGFDVPETVEASETKLRVIAAVECRDSALAPSLVSLVVRNTVRVCCVVAR